MSHTDLSAAEHGPAADHSDEISRMRIALARTARRLSQQIPDVGLTPTQLSVLATVAREEDVPLGELADFEGLNPSRVVGKLEPMGLIRRYADPADGRVAHVAITPDGAALQTQIKQARTAVFAAHVSALEPGLQQLLIDVVPALEALAEHLRAVAVPVRPIARPGGDGTAALESRTGDLPTD
jgi:DNA-binding MarR family transcriptional regulator